MEKNQSNSLKNSEPLKKRTLLNWADVRKQPGTNEAKRKVNVAHPQKE